MSQPPQDFGWSWQPLIKNLQTACMPRGAHARRSRRWAKDGQRCRVNHQSPSAPAHQNQPQLGKAQ